MTIELPTIIRAYLTASDRGDVDAIVDCFTHDAIVVDENAERLGRAAIREWREIAATAYEYTVDVRGTTPMGVVDDLERHHVDTHLEGNFPGGQVDLTYRFGLRGGLIARLEIAPTEPAP